MGEFNMTPSSLDLVELKSDYELQNLLSRPTCFKGANLSCIGNFLTTRKSRFMKTLALETRISDHHKLIGLMLKSTFSKSKPETIYYRCYKNFDDKQFKETKRKNCYLWQILTRFTQLSNLC